MSIDRAFESRIVGAEEMDPRELTKHPDNWRKHPASQRKALNSVLETVGWVDSIKVNRNSGRIVDGHLRVDVAIRRKEATVPVVYLDLTEDEERLVLATLDPIGALATTDQETYSKLIGDLGSADQAIRDVAMGSDGLRSLIDSYLPTESKRTKGSMLELLDLTLEDPKTKVEAGQVWEMEPHLLIVADVMTEWQRWVPLLRDGMKLAPYAGPFTSIIAVDEPLLIVQPDPYVAGHIIDSFIEINGLSKAILRA